MPRYFFDVHDGSSFPDNEGTELPDLAAARNEAVQLAGSLLSDNPEAFWRGEEWRIDVSDGNRLTLFTLMFAAYDAPSLATSHE